MHQNDFEGFAKLLKRLAVTYGKKLDDELTQAYWTALKDQPLDRIATLAEHRMKHSKFFPKPVELRPMEESAPPSLDGKFEHSCEIAIENLEALRQRVPRDWLAYLRKHRPACRAIDYAEEFGPENIWYVPAEKGWRHA